MGPEMALIRKIDEANRSDRVFRPRVEVRCEYLIRADSSGKQFLQINTYASAEAQTDGVKQTLQFSPEAIAELRKILNEKF